MLIKKRHLTLKYTELSIKAHKAILSVVSVLVIIIVGLLMFALSQSVKIQQGNAKYASLQKNLSSTQKSLKELQNQDQYKINEGLKHNISDIQISYKQALDLYQRIQDLKAQKQDTNSLDKEFAQSLNYLSSLNYSSGSASLKQLSADVKKAEDTLVQSQNQSSTPQNVAQSNTPPGNGFAVQSVSTSNGNFTVYIIAADLNSTKVIVDTASDGDCSNNCPTLPLSTFIQRSGAYAGINGTYFCPQEYPSCAGKTGSFDLLVMNKNKVYFNSSNNVYSTNPAVIFYGNSARFVSQALQWGRDTGVDAVLSNYPLLVSGGNVVYNGGGDAKYAPKSVRTFVANKGSMAYIGIVFNATMQDSANVMKALGMDNAMNLDQGGSTALWFNGSYKAGPGRNIANALLFVRK